MTNLMRTFPPAGDEQVTLANWRSAPYTHWALHHVREIVPTASIPNDPDSIWALRDAPVDLSMLTVAAGAEPPVSFASFLQTTDTDGMVVLHRGQCVFETYANGMTRYDPHILFSVSKSMLGLLAGILVDRQVLDPGAPVTAYVPEMSETAYRAATVRDLLDMRSGVHFVEDYMATSGPIIEYRKATGWNPLEPGEAPGDLRGFYAALTKTECAPGGNFHYISPNTDLLGWVIERAAGRRYPDLMSELLWRPLGTEREASITVDRFGAPRAAGGMSATVRDLARVGQMILQDGSRDGRQVVPGAWIEDLYDGGDAAAWQAGDFAPFFPGLDMHYRSKWYLLRGAAPILFGIGIHGQNLYIDRRHDVVIAKMSSRGLPLDTDKELLALAAAQTIGRHLGG